MEISSGKKSANKLVKNKEFFRETRKNMEHKKIKERERERDGMK